MPNDRVTMDKIIEGDGKTIPRFGSIVTVDYVGFLAPTAQVDGISSVSQAGAPFSSNGKVGQSSIPQGSGARKNTATSTGGAAANQGRKFDSTLDRKRPFVFRVGMGEVIKGWDEGIRQMSKGERSRLFFPASLAYGEKGFPGLIPPNCPIVFEVTLLDVA